MAETPITTQEPQPQEGNLTIADLQTISNIIDIAMTRGAFRANEAKTVGEKKLMLSCKPFSKQPPINRPSNKLNK